MTDTFQSIGEAAKGVVDKLAKQKEARLKIGALDPGIYFNLPDDHYHADRALGSTDIRRVLRSAPDFWWHSALNPLRPADNPTPQQLFGKAVHLCILEGVTAFTANYAPTSFSGATTAGKDERKKIAAEGKTPLKRDEYDRIVVAEAMIRANPNLADAFSNGRSEVSVFWEADGVPMKCRFDFLKPRSIVDLKSIRNSMGIDFVECCRRRFADGRYDIQAEHYREGRMQMRGLLQAGKVHGPHDPKWLERVAGNPEFAFVFVFWQAEDAPITWSCSLSPGNPILETGRRDIEYALKRYREFMQKFGPDTAWVLADPVTEIDINELPAWWARAVA